MIILSILFFPKDPHNPNNFAWNYLKGIVRDPEEASTGYEEHDWMYNKPLFTSIDNLRYDKHYHIVKPIINKLNIKKQIFDIHDPLIL